MSSAIATQRQQVLNWLGDAVPEKRLHHILRVEAMAVDLAQHHQLDVDAARLAGLMHDLAKCFPPEELLGWARAEGWTLDPTERQSPHLLHAPVGALVARDTFGIDDPRILAAIANHTLGAPDMDALSCVVYLADSLEPGRGDDAQLHHLRQLCYEDLSTAVYETCVVSLKHLLQTGRLIHPRTILTRNGFLMASRQQRSLTSAA